MTYVRASSETAEWLAKCATVGKYPLTDRTLEGLRDYCDVSTNSELTAYQLDRLTDMVARRVKLGGRVARTSADGGADCICGSLFDAECPRHGKYV